MFITEKFQKLNEDFKALETSFNSTKTDYDASVKKITALETQVTDLTKVKSDLEGKIKTLTDNPNITAQVETLTKENTEYKTKLEALSKEKEEISAKVLGLEKEVESKASAKAAEIIASGKVPTPLPITADVQPTMDVTAFLEELEKKPSISAKSDFINKNQTLWKQVLVERERSIKGK